jgi:hypothetical protein
MYGAESTDATSVNPLASPGRSFIEQIDAAIALRSRTFERPSTGANDVDAADGLTAFVWGSGALVISAGGERPA